ncbi:HD domain-containing protein [Hamadaea tsunoensis]|uniref:HD domain-containing protein n=1 Tax=Hamadaea tsunoensis TaxID=53368 RepID=UPI0003FBE737|nr:HD domain-containing protein [Hamadaea tsunoensis]
MSPLTAPAATPATLTATAAALAAEVLRDLPGRLRHSAGVARRARDLSTTVAPADRDLLVAAAWLHDVGYGADAYETGFHALDGARYLRRNGWPARLCALVAYHSGAKFAAPAHGVTLAGFTEERSPVADALTYADQTTDPAGRTVTLQARMAEMLSRHGVSSVQADIQPVREPHLRAIEERVTARLTA